MLTIGAVFVTEMINTAIEYTVDLASPEKHELARKAKDVSAGGRADHRGQFCDYRTDYLSSEINRFVLEVRF